MSELSSRRGSLRTAVIMHSGEVLNMSGWLKAELSVDNLSNYKIIRQFSTSTSLKLQRLLIKCTF